MLGNKYAYIIAIKTKVIQQLSEKKQNNVNNQRVRGEYNKQVVEMTVGQVVPTAANGQAQAIDQVVGAVTGESAYSATSVCYL